MYSAKIGSRSEWPKGCNVHILTFIASKNGLVKANYHFMREKCYTYINKVVSLASTCIIVICIIVLGLSSDICHLSLLKAAQYLDVYYCLTFHLLAGPLNWKFYFSV